MNRSHVFLQRMFALLAGVVMLVAASAATANGPGAPGGGPGPALPLAALLLDSQVHAQLGLSTAQETAWTALQTAVANARTQDETADTSLRSLITAELADATPDLVAIENAVVAARQAEVTADNAISTQAIALYTSLSTGQQAIVIAALRAGPRGHH
jgi:hypothetical protein